MATSGDSTYNITRNKIISKALQKCGVLPEGETATAQQTNDASEDLNGLIKGWEADGIRLWKEEELILFLVADQESYDVGPSGGNVVIKSDLVTTTLSADATVPIAAPIEVTSITGIADGDIIGFVQDDNTIHWDIVNGTPTDGKVTITVGNMTAASSGNAVYAYTTNAPRPVQIKYATNQISSTSEIELNRLGRDDYFRLSNKSTSGTTTQFYYKRVLTNGKLYIWPTADDERLFLNLISFIAIEDFDASGDNPDFPQEWIQALIWGLASEIMVEYGVDDATKSFIQGKADFWFDKVDGFDVDDASIIFMPDLGFR